MKPVSDLAYFIEVEGDRVPLEASMTVGRHLDNQLLLSGEDVLDYHLRLELTGRGPRAVPLGEASLRVSGRDYSEPVGLMPGDRLEIGQSLLELVVEARHPAEAEEWRLHRAGDGAGRPLTPTFRVGRSAENEVQLDDDHISRFHAQLASWFGSVWVRDLASANGTFVNGERIGSACRLYHGDEVRFDTQVFQLIGRGGELTPVNPLDRAIRPVPIHVPPAERSTVTGDTVELVGDPDDIPTFTPKLPPRGEAGLFLLGASDAVTGVIVRTPMGLTVIGRHEDCDLVLRDRTVSSRHAELRVRAEGVTLTNLMSTNGTWVNGEEVQSARLRDGDVLRLGRVKLVFKEVTASGGARRRLRYAQMALLLGSLIVAIGLIAMVW